MIVTAVRSGGRGKASVRECVSVVVNRVHELGYLLRAERDGGRDVVRNFLSFPLIFISCRAAPVESAHRVHSSVRRTHFRMCVSTLTHGSRITYTRVCGVRARAQIYTGR